MATKMMEIISFEQLCNANNKKLVTSGSSPRITYILSFSIIANSSGLS